MSTFGDLISDGISTLQHAVPSGAITNPSGAVIAMQAAANGAVAAVGPAIDSFSSGNPDVMKMTQWAWQKNAELAAMTDDVQSAAAAVRQMADWYGQAYRLAQSLKATAAATPTATSTPSVYTPVLKVAAPAPSALPPGYKPAVTLRAPAPATSPIAQITKYVPKSPAAGAGIFGSAALGGLLGARFVVSAAGGPVGLLVGAAVGYAVTRALGLK